MSKAKSPGRPAKSTRDDVTVKVDRSVIAKARHVAYLRRIDLAEYLTATLRGIVDRDFDKATKGGAE